MVLAAAGPLCKAEPAEAMELVDQVEELLTQPLAELGYRLMDVDFRFEGRWVLRLVIDREQGISLDDCGAVSRLAGEVLDEEDPISEKYSLEVTSPGLFRSLRKPKHFRQSVGLLARIRLADAFRPERKDRGLRGMIVDAGEEGFTLESEGAKIELPYEGVRSAKLDPDF